MISYMDIAFLVATVCMVFVNAHRGLLVSLLGMLRFIFIIPLSYMAAEYAEPYIPNDMFADIPEQLEMVILFVVCFIVLWIITSIILFYLKKLQHKKDLPLHNTNAVLGGVFGLIKAIVFVFISASVLGYIMQFLPQISELNAVYDSLNNSYVIEFVNSFNIFEILGN